MCSSALQLSRYHRLCIAPNGRSYTRIARNVRSASPRMSQSGGLIDLAIYKQGLPALQSLRKAAAPYVQSSTVEPSTADVR